MMQQAAILWHVNKVFFMGGPQLGELEAGLLANWRGAPFSVIAGGVGTLVATAVMATTVPVLRHYRRDQSAHLDSTVTLLPEASLTEPPTRDSAGV